MNSFTYGDMIKIRLNDSTCEYVVDKKVICKSSTLIREMLSASDLKKSRSPKSLVSTSNSMFTGSILVPWRPRV